MPSSVLYRAQNLTAGVAFLTPLAATVALYLPSGLLMPTRLALLLLATLALTTVLRERRFPAPWTTWVTGVVVGVLVLCGIFASIRFNVTSAVEVADLGFILLGLVAALLLAATPQLTVGLLAGWLASAVLAGVVGIWENLTGQHLPSSVGVTAALEAPGWNEITSWFDNPNLYAYHCTVVLLLIPMAGSLLRDSRWRWALVPFGLIVVGLLARTHGQMALLAFGLGAAWWCLRSRIGRWCLTAGLLLLVITAALQLPPGWNVYRSGEVALDGLQWEGKSTYIRAALARTAWWVAEQTGFLGAGPGGFERWALREDAPSYPTGFSNAHWGILEILANYGVVTLVVLLAALLVGVAASVRLSRHLLRSGNPRAAGLVYGAGALALTLPVLSMSHSTWLAQPLTAVHLVTLVAVFARGEFLRHREEISHHV